MKGLVCRELISVLHKHPPLSSSVSYHEVLHMYHVCVVPANFLPEFPIYQFPTCALAFVPPYVLFRYNIRRSRCRQHNSNDGTKHQFRPHDRIVIEWHASRSADERLRGPQANESSRSFLAADAARQLAVIESSFFGRETLVCACVFR